MTFNYESAWLFDAPKQTRMNCAIQLYNAIEDDRGAPGQSDFIKHRPIVFVAHSFGGVVVEQAILIGTQQQSLNLQGLNLAMLTAGIVFLGTPHRGSQASSWAYLIANVSGLLRFGAEPRILKDLEAFSETMKDLLYDFSQWIHRYQVPIWCFFESHATDVGARASSWFGNVCVGIIVGEESACIDGTRKERLSADHMKLAKFAGPQDPSYVAIYPKLQRMAHDAVSVTNLRAHRGSRPYACDNRNIPAEHVDCLRSLFCDLEQPIDHKNRLLRSKGGRTEATCEWITREDKFVKWRNSEDKALLRLTGPPGIGKTIMSTYLIEELTRCAEISSTLFAFCFYDGMPELDQAARIVRTLLAQLLQQCPKLFSHIRPEYDIHQDQLRNRFDALWRILRQIMFDPDSPTMIFLIDALDECSTETQAALSREISELFDTKLTTKAKILIASRPELVIERTFNALGTIIPIESAGIRTDLAKYIHQETRKLKDSNHLPERTVNVIKDALSEKNDGTFLWVSFVIEDLRSGKTGKQMMAMLSTLPRKLSDIYDRILLKIPESEQKEAIQVFQAIIARPNPWPMDELAMLFCILDPNTTTVPQPDDFGQWLSCHSFCGSLVQLTTAENRYGTSIYGTPRTYVQVELVHSSVRDYLVSEVLRQHPRLSRYHCNIDESRLAVFSACCKYRKLLGPQNIAEDEEINDLRDSYQKCNDGDLPLFRYCSYKVYSDASYFDLVSHSDVNERLRDRVCEVIEVFKDPGFLHLAFKNGLVTLADYLLEQDWVDVRWVDDYYPILCTAMDWFEGDNESLLLQSTGSQSKVQTATGSVPFRRYQVAEKLFQHPRLDVNLGDGIALFMALMPGSNGMLRRLLAHRDIDVNVSDLTFGTPLTYAMKKGPGKNVARLLEHPNIDVNKLNCEGKAAMHIALRRDSKNAVKMLLKHPQIDVNIRDRRLSTALHIAAYEDKADVVAILLGHPDIDINIRDHKGETALAKATCRLHPNVVKLLLGRPDANLGFLDEKDLSAFQWPQWKYYCAVRRMIYERLDLEAQDDVVLDPRYWLLQHDNPSNGFLSWYRRCSRSGWM